MHRHGCCSLSLLQHAAVLRYDDGDTKISDGLRLKEGRLLRMVNVVTDELYTDRQLVAYQREDR